MKKKYTPFSKKNVIYARVEAYAFTLVLVVLILLDKDVSAFAAALLGLAWGGYKLLQGLYIKMAEREHLEEIRQGRLHENLDTSDIDMEIEVCEDTPIEHEEVIY